MSKIEIAISEGEYQLGKVAKDAYHTIKGRQMPADIMIEEWLKDLLIGAIKVYSK